MAKSKQATNAELSPEELHQLSFAFVPSQVLSTGVELAVFSHLAAGKQTVEEVARAAKASRRGMRMLLDALVACQLLTKENSRYRLMPMARKFLVRQSPDYLGAMMERGSFWEPWIQLTQSVRTGKPTHRVNRRENAEQFFPILVRSLHVLNRKPAQTAAQALGAGRSQKGLSVVDVACGSGVWGISMAEADPQARITAQDFPAMLKVTRKFVKRHAVQDRFRYLPGDLNQVEFGEKQFDLAILGHIVHSEGERSSRRLFRRLYRALREGGRIAIADMIPNEDRSGPPFPVFFALNMLLNTEMGDTYTFAEYAQWLTEAGFERVKTADIGSHSPLIIGFK